MLKSLAFSFVFLLFATPASAQVVLNQASVPACTNGQTLVYNSGTTAWECGAVGAGTITGSATAGTIPKMSGATAIADSILTESGSVLSANTGTTVGSFSGTTYTLRGTTSGTLGLTLGTGAYGTSSIKLPVGSTDFTATGPGVLYQASAGAAITVTPGVTATSGAFSATLDVTGTSTLGVVNSGALTSTSLIDSETLATTRATSSNVALAVFTNSHVTNNGAIITVANVGNSVQLGVDRSTGGGVWTGGAAYDGAVGSSGNVAFGFATNGTIRARFDAPGNFLPATDNTYNLGTTGTMRWKDIFAVTKTSSLDVSWTPSKSVLVSVLEGPEYRLYDSGTVTLDATGAATVNLDPHYVEVTNTEMPYQVMASGAAVRNKTPNGFTLKGQPGDSADWMISATRAGFENVRWRDMASETKEPLGLSDPWNVRNLKSKDNNTVKEKVRVEPTQVTERKAKQALAECEQKNEQIKKSGGTPIVCKAA